MLCNEFHQNIWSLNEVQRTRRTAFTPDWLRALTNQLLENHSEQIVLYVTAISVSHQLGLLFKIPNVPRETFPQ